MTADCIHERDVIEAVASGEWPAAAEPALQAHVAVCDSCSALADLATMLHEDHDALCREAQIPSAAQIWRRAAIRTRVEAQHAAAQPIIVTERLAAACATGVLFAAFTWVAPARGMGGRRDARRDTPRGKLQRSDDCVRRRFEAGAAARHRADGVRDPGAGRAALSPVGRLESDFHFDVARGFNRAEDTPDNFGRSAEASRYILAEIARTGRVRGRRPARSDRRAG